VGIGVALSLLLQLNREALDLSVVELVRRPDGRFAEQPAPERLPSRSVTVLDVYGSLYYAGARTLEAQLPDPAGAVAPVVVLRLRGRTALGATGFSVLAGYARRLDTVGGRLYLSGVDPILMEQARRNRQLDVTGPVRAFAATELIGESTEQAVLDAEAWLIRDEP
jgi:SulP family sulfate permease